uniref:Uncharacterized protein n=1 Tax=Siphoviridae sp. ctD2Q91 TaxID=2825383 RepID=A0A8S5PQJ0_9CAUD|nr:MAG TPA: hypothetical protein [Siphoviridae sp. ctD2Q91]
MNTLRNTVIGFPLKIHVLLIVQVSPLGPKQKALVSLGKPVMPRFFCVF